MRLNAHAGSDSQLSDEIHLGSIVCDCVEAHVRHLASKA